MRTTLNIDAPVLRDLRRLQKQEGKSIGRVASELIAEALAQRKRGQRSKVAVFAWTAKRMRALVDLEDKDAVYSVLDGVDT